MVRDSIGSLDQVIGSLKSVPTQSVGCSKIDMEMWANLGLKTKNKSDWWDQIPGANPHVPLHFFSIVQTAYIECGIRVRSDFDRDLSVKTL
jgi:hypothetical protein